MQLHGASDLHQRCLKTRNFKDGCTFPLNVFAPTPKIPFWGSFNAKPIIQIALRKSHVNGATKVKLYSYIGIGEYLGCVKRFSLGRSGRSGGPLNVNLEPPIISKTTGAIKLKLKTQLDLVKYSLWVQKLLYYTTQHEDGRHTDFRQMSIYEADYG